METENKELYEAAKRIVAAAREIINRMTEAIDEMLDVYIPVAADMITRVINEVVDKIAVERSREDVKRQPVREIARPQPPKNKRPRIFRCRNSC
jgi:F0F1-type ATP synthase beta subunit